MRGVFSKENNNNLFFVTVARVSLYCKLVPVQYRENDYGLLTRLHASWMRVYY